MSVQVTGSLLEREVLEPVLDARAFNLTEPRVVGDELHHLAALARVVHGLRGPVRDLAAGEIDGVAAGCRELMAANGSEGRFELHVAGVVDSLVHDLRHAERNLTPGRVLGAKAIARALRDPLDILLDPAGHDATTVVRAAWAVRDIVDRVPAVQLASDDVATQLRARKHKLLLQIVRQRESAGRTR